MSDLSSSFGSYTVTVNVPVEITVRLGAPRIENGKAVVEAASVDVRPNLSPDPAFAIDEDYDNRMGYDESYLGGEPIPIPTLSAAQLRDAALDQTREGEDRHVLRYHHFSVVMNGKRRLLFFAAANTTRDPEQMGHQSRSKLSDGKGDKWILDPRISAAQQIQTKELYSKIHFDRGHIIRREDVYWGATSGEAAFANFDSFHYTNCTPQEKSFNRATVGDGIWGKLENHIATSAESDGDRLSYFAGPIFRAGRTLAGAFVPYEFFKVVIAKRRGNRLAAWAFRLSQKQQVIDAPEPIFDPGAFETFLISIGQLEKLTGLTFPEVVKKIDVRRNDSCDQLFTDLRDVPEVF